MIAALVFASGFAALVYQVLWLRDLGRLFGNTAQAAAVDVAVFFGGLAIGAAVFGRVTRHTSHPLRVYALVEGGIAIAALAVLVLFDPILAVYRPLVAQVQSAVFARAALDVLLAAIVLGPAAVLMGGTIPLIVQHLVRHPESLGRRGARLYAVNTAGATTGAFAAGFLMPPLLGFRGSYLVAILTNAVVATVAFVLSRDTAEAVSHPPEGSSRETRRRRSRQAPKPPTNHTARAGLLAFLSGVLTLAMEIVWVRMFAQVLDHSVYTFSAVLVVFLIALAAGAALASQLAGRDLDPSRTLAWLLVAGAAAVAFQASIFVTLTAGLAQVGTASSWSGYVGQVFRLVGLVVFVPTVLIGTVFPYLLRAVGRTDTPGATVARLSYLNLIGGIVGSLTASFVALPQLGLWRTVQLIAVAYGLSAAATGIRGARLAAVVAGTLLVALIARPSALPLVYLDPARGERILATWEGADGVVAVTESREGRLLRLNNSYQLGGTVARIERERLQVFLPLVLHPRPESAFILGLGTGITAGEAVRHPLSRIVVCELVPEVVEASRDYFGEWTRGLYRDPRVEICVDDGRHRLMTNTEAFDVIVSDLFVPWHAGTGSLYTREHFDQVRARLKPNGIFAQWLPLFQLSEADFAIIARTMLDVFPNVTVWRGDFYANQPIVALIATAAPTSLDPRGIEARVARATGSDAGTVLARLLPFYAGNLSAAPDILGDGPLNTDNDPLIEYGAPSTQWRRDSGLTPWFVGDALVNFTRRLHDRVPASRDPYLAALTTGEREYVIAGAAYYRAITLRVAGQDNAAQQALAEALDRMPEAIPVAGPFMALDPLLR